MNALHVFMYSRIGRGFPSRLHSFAVIMKQYILIEQSVSTRTIIKDPNGILCVYDNLLLKIHTVVDVELISKCLHFREIKQLR